MKLRDRRIGLWFAGLQTEPWVDVLDDDERGIWVRTTRPGAKHVALIRWEYIALVEVQLGALAGVDPMKKKGLRE